MKRFFFLIILLTSVLFNGVVLPESALSQSQSSIHGSFVDIGFGTRPAGLGNAFAGLADDVNSVYLNPAGLVNMSDRQAVFTHARHFGLVDHHFFTAGTPFRNRHAAGMALIASGDDLMREMALHLGYAMRYRQFSVGAAAKVRYTSFGNNLLHSEDYHLIFEPDEIQEGIMNQVSGNGLGAGMDLGILYDAGEELRFGLYLRDIFAPFWWGSQSANPEKPSEGNYNQRIPFEMGVGSSYKIRESVLFTTEYRPAFSDEQDQALRFGIEAVFLDVLAMRAGTEQWINNLDDDKYMVGFGVITPKVTGVHAKLNYTYMMDDLANTHRFGLAIHF